MSPTRALTALALTAAVMTVAERGALRAQAVPWPSLPAEVADAIARVPGAEVAVSVVDLADDRAWDLGGDVVYHAASMMKVPVLLELFRRADQGGIALDESVPLRNEFPSLVDGSPYTLTATDDSDDLVYTWVGRRVTWTQLAERMITHSSNLATNAVIARLGAEAITATAHARGASPRTVVRRGVEDQKAFDRGINNEMTTNDLARLFVALERGQVAGPAGTARMREILLAQAFNGGIPTGLPPGVRFGHKTGEIRGHFHDGGIVYPATDAPYVLVVFTRGLADTASGEALAAGIARVVHRTVRSAR
ncbi:MAG: serine hydrolase [Vicinamibacterales bacterium]